jgi:hypothetical protein
MRIYSEEVVCRTCPNRAEMKDIYKPAWLEEYEGRYLCCAGEELKEIKLHESLDEPDWCPLPVSVTVTKPGEELVNPEMRCACFHRFSSVIPENCYNCVHRNGYPAYLFGDENCTRFVELWNPCK